MSRYQPYIDRTLSPEAQRASVAAQLGAGPAAPVVLESGRRPPSARALRLAAGGDRLRAYDEDGDSFG